MGGVKGRYRPGRRVGWVGVRVSQLGKWHLTYPPAEHAIVEIVAVL